MKSILSRLVVLWTLSMSLSMAYAVDSYRYAHVTIETPWAIFIFLLVIIMLPFVLMAVLYWYFATKKTKPEISESD